MAARLAAARRDKAVLEKIDETLHSLREAIKMGTVDVEADFAFHKAVAEASGNAYFSTTLHSLEQSVKTAMLLNRQLSLQNPVQRLDLVQAEHKVVYEAILCRRWGRRLRGHVQACPGRAAAGVRRRRPWLSACCRRFSCSCRTGGRSQSFSAMRSRSEAPAPAPRNAVKTRALHLDFLRDLKHVNAHLASVAYPMPEGAGALREYPAWLRRVE